MDDRPEAAQARCSQCGEANASDAPICAQCGAPLAAQAEPHTMPIASAPIASAPIASAQEPAMPTAAGSTVPEGQRRCEWCGELSPAGEERCVHCEAVFPRPEQDAAYLRAAEERLRAANDTLVMMQRQRARRGLGRFFGR